MSESRAGVVRGGSAVERRGVPVLEPSWFRFSVMVRQSEVTM